MIKQIEYMRQKNVVHCNMRPENQIFNEQGYLKLNNFKHMREMKDGQDVMQFE